MRSLQKGQGPVILLIVFAVVILVGGFVFYTQTQAPQTTSTQDQSGQATNDVIDTGGDALENQDLMDDIISDPATLSVNLEDVSGGAGSGTAFVLRKGGKLWHTVSANLPDPSTGTVYEGWLVNKTPTLAFFSTGVMQKQANGSYMLSYTSSNTYESYNDVVITLETKVDETPEEHILEGTVN